MDNNKQPYAFDVEVYGELESYNQVLSKARCRIFYKGENRNGSFITDEFAEKLLSTISYTPIKGIYDDDDYGEHGKGEGGNAEGKIYGIVPLEPNVQWEVHEDYDGEKREYACVDVLLFTAIYEEAKEIVGKSMSMELYRKSITGETKVIEGKKLFVFLDACFIGLQVLGDEVEPCFEGAGFFTLYETVKNAYEEYAKSNKEEEGGEEGMNENNIIFKLSHEGIRYSLYNALNKNKDEDGYAIMDYWILEVYDDYVLVLDRNDELNYRFYYSVDNDDVVALGDKVRTFITDLTEEENTALETIKAYGENSFSAVETALNEFEELKEEKMTLVETLEDANAKIETLKEYKLEKEMAEKDAVFEKFQEKLSEKEMKELREQFSTKMETLTKEELDKELVYTLFTTKPEVFQKAEGNTKLPKDHKEHNELAEVISRFKDKK